ncbi:ribonuclease HI family protein [Shouchella patagoniensis]|uniref:ribonuclease HI family protein n=1 Tax=Shouchella patagoniensis TaxID=228576 RepID=UPI0009956E5E|nr:ribonuclease HI family protein [Shouchella patagoniensis]
MIHLYTDGASAGDPGVSGAGIVIVQNDGHVSEHRYHLGEMTNHEAEFAALNIALSLCLDKGFKHVSARTDSKLVSDCIDKRYVKNKLFATYLTEVLEKIDAFELFFIKWVPSKQNKKADELARLAIREPKRIY